MLCSWRRRASHTTWASSRRRPSFRLRPSRPLGGGPPLQQGGGGPPLQQGSIFGAGSWAAVRAVRERFERLQEELNQPTAAAELGPREFAARVKEMGKLEEAAGVVRDIEAGRAELASLREMAAAADEDPELRAMAEAEVGECEEGLERLERDALRFLLPPDRDDDRNAVIEVRAGTGGDEAAIFAMDLFRMYEKYAALRGWRYEVVSMSATDHGGCREAMALLSGDDVFGALKYETGTHRVQRVPVTEGAGRVHTSAATVALMPEAEEVDIDIDERDLRIDTYRSGGKGGQSVNTTDSAVRITHVPTNTVVAIQDERSQVQNRKQAMKVLRIRLYEKERARLAAERKEMRMQMVGRGDRSERIRTYNFAQGRITDHRINESKFDMERMLNGEFIDEFTADLKQAEQLEALQVMNDDAKK